MPFSTEGKKLHRQHNVDVSLVYFLLFGGQYVNISALGVPFKCNMILDCISEYIALLMCTVVDYQGEDHRTFMTRYCSKKTPEAFRVRDVCFMLRGHEKWWYLGELVPLIVKLMHEGKSMIETVNIINVMEPYRCELYITESILDNEEPNPVQAILTRCLQYAGDRQSIYTTYDPMDVEKVLTGDQVTITFDEDSRVITYWSMAFSSIVDVARFIPPQYHEAVSHPDPHPAGNIFNK